jgi:cephalosporin hydroxylase
MLQFSCMQHDATRRTIDAFHTLYYDGPIQLGRIYERTFWMGIPCLKCPLDLWIYQEILVETRPDLIIETGTHLGGTTLFLAHMCDLLGHGQVVSVDINADPSRPAHPRIRYVTGSSTDPHVISSIFDQYPAEHRLAILDADHSKTHVLAELQLLAPYISVGSYVIVEDTNVNGHPVCPTFGDGPHEAVEAFLQTTDDFVVDESREKFLLTFQPRGYLKRVSVGQAAAGHDAAGSAQRSEGHSRSSPRDAPIPEGQDEEASATPRRNSSVGLMSANMKGWR